MKMNVYSIFDTATKAYMRPFFMQADGQAMRAFSDLVADRDHDVGRHPEDYSLMRIGVWDDQTAKYAAEEPDSLLTGLQVLAERTVVQSDPDRRFLVEQEQELSDG